MVQRGANYERKERDFYPTPPRPVELLLRARRFAPTLVDPCCGDGAMLEVFNKFGHEAIGSDIDPRCMAVTWDFFEDPYPINGPFDIVTNPPFGTQGATALWFIRRALNLTQPWEGQVCMLLPVDFDSGSTRVGVFKNMPCFAETLVMLERIVWFPREERVSPAQNWAWFCWDWQHRGPSIKSYIGG
jgi:hypothetical protein